MSSFPTDDPDDQALAVEILASAFWNDPVWSWAFPDSERRTDQFRALWPLIVSHSAEQGSLWVDRGAAAVWFAPGTRELSADDEARLPEFVTDLVGPIQAAKVFELWERFDAARPADPHVYLSLLGTHDDARGRGHGMRLLRESIASYSASGHACYLESTNPANNARYESVGFTPIGTIEVGDGVPNITTMWRPAPG
jgi:ribosomal protein S18 acetylase RimI-like enzyme